ncbi:flagellar biosynthesis protein FlhA [Azospirillum sp. TSO22-1]|uniref:flagellar biosynthesis protein FlhA n=1 Tax=Azospirillum sp. TSO22-1 TaxID=716789 RepID=UPI000D61B077|nr:flagellar biosynthesis protein FlhA [Azospirillum sp. TSO22-1]PWC42585.1 flagellar biosynthesis protein FlhA [Azospirillum sp. TSO22-1]
MSFTGGFRSTMSALGTVGLANRDVMFAIGIVLVLAVLFLPIPTWLLDLGLALSLSVSVLILMVALWIAKPLDFSSFPTVLLVVTMLRLALNIASTRLVLSQGHTGTGAAGHVIEGFSRFVMGGNFVIGVVIFCILVVINFVVITKGATRIAEVGARFTLDAIPGKQMAIDADLSAGLIDDTAARARRKELEDESTFYGAMDGASKFVRGDAVAGLIITAINVLGGMAIGVAQQGMPFDAAAATYTMLTVGDGLATQVPALIVSLAAGLLVTKGGNTGSVDKAVIDQLGGYPKALMVAGGLLGALALAPGLPMGPFALLGAGFGTAGWYLPRQRARQAALAKLAEGKKAPAAAAEETVEEMLRVDDVKVEVGNHLVPLILNKDGPLTGKVKTLRKRFAKEFGFILPSVRIKDSSFLPPKGYVISIMGVEVANGEVRPKHLMAIDPSGGEAPDIQGETTREPTFGLQAKWIDPARHEEAVAKGYTVVDPDSVITTHLTEVIKDHLPNLLTFAAVQKLIDGLPREYQKLINDMVPSQITLVVVQRVLQALLAERVSIRNLPAIVEAVAEAVNWTRNITMIAEHVRIRLGQQICKQLTGSDGFIPVIALTPTWEQALLENIVTEGEDRRFAMPPSQVQELLTAIRTRIQKHASPSVWPALLVAAEVRPFVRSLLERVSPMTPIISHAELHRKAALKTVDQV